MIVIESLAKSFRRVRVLDDLSLRIERGERVALVGSNGAGKTTLIRCLLGEYVHDGAITIDGLAPRADRRAVLPRIGFVPQQPPPLRMPVAELVRFAAGVADADPARIVAVANRLGLDLSQVGRRPFVKLSGGQKQKLLIACALGRAVDLLILDEPAANLDPPARQVLFELLAERPDATMLISSHRLDEVAALVNRVVELDGGRVTLDDRVEDSVAAGARLACEVVLSRPDLSFAHAVRDWGLQPGDGGVRWHGTVAGGDRLRFLGLLSRYAGILVGVHLDEQQDTAADQAAERRHVH